MNSDEALKYRGETRRERYERRLKDAQIIPVSIACINFDKDANVAYVVRAAACFGAFEVCLIGSKPDRDLMNDLSGSLYDYVKFREFSTPERFVSYCKGSGIKMVAFELPSDAFPAVSLDDYEFDFGRRSCLIVGHETIGVPVEILAASERVYIPMRSIGYCLNTSQTANVALFEANNRYTNWKSVSKVIKQQKMI